MFAGCALLCAATLLPGQSPPQAAITGSIQPPPSGFQFPNNTTYVYEVEWRLWNAGTATIKMENLAGEQHVHVEADSAGFVSLLYKVHDRFDSYFDPRTFCSSRILKHTEEGLRKRDTAIRFNAARGKAELAETNLRSNERKQAEHDIPACVTDVISALLYAGSLPLADGATYVFPLADGSDTVDVKLHVQGREQVKTQAGTFRAVKTEPEANKGVLKERGRVWVWFTDDAQRIPVQMRARLFWGTLTFKLLRVEK